MAESLQVLQARRAAYQLAYDKLVTGNLRSGLEASTGAGSNRVGYHKPEAERLRTDILLLDAQIARLTGDLSAVRRAIYL